MQKQRSQSPEVLLDRAASKPEIDYSPKNYSLRAQIVYGLKLAVIMGIVLVAFWLYEVYWVK